MQSAPWFSRDSDTCRCCPGRRELCSWAISLGRWRQSPSLYLPFPVWALTQEQRGQWWDDLMEMVSACCLCSLLCLIFPPHKPSPKLKGEPRSSKTICTLHLGVRDEASCLIPLKSEMPSKWTTSRMMCTWSCPLSQVLEPWWEERLSMVPLWDR